MSARGDRDSPLSARAAVLSGLLLLLAVPSPASNRFIDYLYVNANEGGSSGGHVAIRFGDRTYHFQYHPGGLLRLHRDDSERFLHTYSVLENRSIDVSRIAVSRATFDGLRSSFNRRHLVQSEQFARRAALRGDRELIEMLLRRKAEAGAPGGREGPDAVYLRAVGFFFPDGRVPPDVPRAGQVSATGRDLPGAQPLVDLRHRIAEAHGKNFVRRRIDELYARLLRLKPDDADWGVVELAADRVPEALRAFSRRYGELMVGLMALQVLQAAPDLRPDAYAAPAGDEFELTAGELGALAAFCERLQGDLIRLVRSRRPDWGYPFLVGMARLVTLRQSLASGRFAFLDAFPAAPEVVRHSALRRRAAILPALVAAARRELRLVRARLLARGRIREADFSALEAASNRFLELYRAVGEGRDLRVSSGRMLPSRGALRTDLVVPDVSAAELAGALERALSNQRAYEQQLRRLYGYNLISRNCVSEIFRAIDASLTALGPQLDGGEDAAGRVREESVRRLGGYVETAGSLNFIPFVSAGAVNRAYDIAVRRQIPSYRKARLAEMYRRENPAAVYLREFNTLTSTIYERREGGSFFVLFTDDIVAVRPLYGATNVVAGLAAGVVGLALLPAYGGEAFLSGVRGVLFSLPELAFFNIRKGTSDYVPPGYSLARAPPPLSA